MGSVKNTGRPKNLYYSVLFRFYTARTVTPSFLFLEWESEDPRNPLLFQWSNSADLSTTPLSSTTAQQFHFFLSWLGVLPRITAVKANEMGLKMVSYFAQVQNFLRFLNTLLFPFCGFYSI